MDSNADSNGIRVVGIRGCMSASPVLSEQCIRYARGCPRMPKMTLGVNWLQVQILSARPKIAVQGAVFRDPELPYFMARRVTATSSIDEVGGAARGIR
jgi:hypothetical protein